MSVAIGFGLIFLGMLFCVYEDLGWFGVIAVPVTACIAIIGIAAVLWLGDYMGWVK